MKSTLDAREKQTEELGSEDQTYGGAHVGGACLPARETKADQNKGQAARLYGFDLTQDDALVKHRILLVEDCRAEAELVADMLLSSTHGELEVTWAGDIATAAATFAHAPFDCIVLDLQLPDAAGLASLEGVQGFCGDAAIVAFSALEDCELRETVLAHGAHDFIRKNSDEVRALSRGVLYALERRRAYKLNREFEGLIAANPDAMLVSDEEGVVRFVNRAACEMFECAAEDLIGQRLGFAVCSEDGPSEIDIFRNGHTRAGEVRMVRCTWDGRPAHLAAIRDVTEQKQFAEILRNSQKMEAIGQFSGGLAHDFGNILGCISLFAETMHRRAAQDGRGTGELENIIRAVESGKSLVQQLSRLARGRAGQPGLVSVDTLVADLEDFLRRTLPSEIELHIDHAPTQWLALIDRGQLEQVVLNLCLNARDAMPKGGDLRIAVLNEKPADGDEHIALRIADTGTGMTPDQLSRAFEPFFTTKREGTGLGLAMCQTIIVQAGGQIDLESAEGEGAIFTIRLPRADAATPLNAPRAES